MIIYINMYKMHYAAGQSFIVAVYIKYNIIVIVIVIVIIIMIIIVLIL